MITPQERADATLMLKLAHDGHTGAFDAFVIRYQNLMLHSVRILGDEDRKDVAQDAWVFMWQNVVQKVEGVDPFCMMMQAAMHARVRFHRARMAKKRGEGKGVAFYTAELLRELHGVHRYRKGAGQFDFTERTPAEDPLRKMGVVRRLASQLPPQHLAALDAVYFKNESLTALAQRIGISFDRANRIVCNGLQILRHLAEEVTPAEWEEAAHAA